jgi:hypothetical protein
VWVWIWIWVEAGAGYEYVTGADIGAAGGEVAMQRARSQKTTGAGAGPAFINRRPSDLTQTHRTDVAGHKSQGSYWNVPKGPGAYSSSSSPPQPQGESYAVHYQLGYNPDFFSQTTAAAARIYRPCERRILRWPQPRNRSIPSRNIARISSPALQSLRRRCYEP